LISFENGGRRSAEAERAQRRASLEKAWEAVRQVASSQGMTPQARAGVVRKFLEDFPADNPHEAEARGLVARLDRGEEPGGAQGRVRVVSTVPEAEVYLDGAMVGTAPVDREVPPGEHYLTVQAKGYARFEQKLALEGGQVVQVTAELRQVGQLQIMSSPPKMEVLLDGARVGTTPVWVEASAGSHVLTVRGEGVHTFEQSVQIEAGKRSMMEVRLEPD
jgi:hypothetical protein